MGGPTLHGSELPQRPAELVTAAPGFILDSSGPLILLSIFIKSADYHSNGCYPSNSYIVIPIIAI